jgi:uncharacterized protein (DUF3084 family)
MRLSLIAAVLVGLAGTVSGHAQDTDLAKQLADAQDKLSTSLHSYTLLADENAKLKADAERAAAETANLQSQLESARKTIDGLKTLAGAAAQLDSLHSQVRQLRDQVASLGQQNYELKNKLAMQGPAPVHSAP